MQIVYLNLKMPDKDDLEERLRRLQREKGRDIEEELRRLSRQIPQEQPAMPQYMPPARSTLEASTGKNIPCHL